MRPLTLPALTPTALTSVVAQACTNGGSHDGSLV